MIILIYGATHTGKTALAQKLLEQYKIPYFSIDHLKMGLIRSGNTTLTANDDASLTPYLWNIVKEIVKTAVENEQSLIVEGCYVPFDWQKDFSKRYLCQIKSYCLIMTKRYIETHFSNIEKYENVVERRMFEGNLSKERLIAENCKNLKECKLRNLDCLIIDDDYAPKVVL